MSWDNYKFINRISENWKNRQVIEEKMTDDSIKRVKIIDLNERENDDTKKFEIKDDHGTGFKKSKEYFKCISPICSECT